MYISGNHLSLTRFISVSNALPKTSYVKMIDIWLLFNLTIPFAEVIFVEKYVASLPRCSYKLTSSTCEALSRTRRRSTITDEKWRST